MLPLATITWDATTITLVAGAVGAIITALCTGIVAIIKAVKGEATSSALQESVTRISTRQNATDDRVATVAQNMTPPTAVPVPSPQAIAQAMNKVNP